MDRIELDADSRQTLGKKVRFLRRESITPAHLYGHGVESLPLQCKTPELQSVLAHAGRTKLIDLHLKKSKKPRTVMVREVQKNVITGQLLHVDFLEVRITEKIRVDVPIVLTGEAEALRVKTNILEHEMDTLTVECLPTKMPSSISVDVSSLTEAGQAIRVKDIKLDGDISILVDPEHVIAKIGTTKFEGIPVEKPEEVAEAEAPEAEA